MTEKKGSDIEIILQTCKTLYSKLYEKTVQLLLTSYTQLQV